MKAVVSLESQLKGREERSCWLNSQRGQRTDGAEREGRDGKREGRALWLIDHFLSEWSGVERGEEFNLKIGISMGKRFAEREKGSDHSVGALGEKKEGREEEKARRREN